MALGINVFAKDNKGKSALDHALDNRVPDYIIKEIKKSMKKQLFAQLNKCKSVKGNLDLSFIKNIEVFFMGTFDPVNAEAAKELLDQNCNAIKEHLSVGLERGLGDTEFAESRETPKKRKVIEK